MENYCLADFALKVNICQQTGPSSNHLLSYAVHKILFIAEEKKKE